MAIELTQNMHWLNINFIDKTIQASLLSIPVVDGEVYPAKNTTSEPITGTFFDNLLALKVSEFGEDATVNDVLDYVASYQIKSVVDSYPIDEKVSAIHEKLQSLSLDITSK